MSHPEKTPYRIMSPVCLALDLYRIGHCDVEPIPTDQLVVHNSENKINTVVKIARHFTLFSKKLFFIPNELVDKQRFLSL